MARGRHLLPVVSTMRHHLVTLDLVDTFLRCLARRVSEREVVCLCSLMRTLL